jgi:ribonuclease M5
MMEEKLKIPYPILVEGKYDRVRLLDVVDSSAQIIKTDGFGIFNHSETAALIRALAQKSRLIVLTDSDGAGKLIRSRICNLVPRDRLIQLYIPQIKGKERRKAAPSKEGTLGVEGMTADLLYDLLLPYADGSGIAKAEENPLTKVDFYIDGLSGGENATVRRDQLAQQLGLPRGMTANALLAAVRLLCTYEEYLQLVGREKSE